MHLRQVSWKFIVHRHHANNIMCWWMQANTDTRCMKTWYFLSVAGGGIKTIPTWHRKQMQSIVLLHNSPIFCCSGKILSFNETFDSLFDDYGTGQETCLELFCHLPVSITSNTNTTYWQLSNIHLPRNVHKKNINGSCWNAARFRHAGTIFWPGVKIMTATFWGVHKSLVSKSNKR